LAELEARWPGVPLRLPLSRFDGVGAVSEVARILAGSLGD
jgi:hypothetical protein